MFKVGRLGTKRKIINKKHTRWYDNLRKLKIYMHKNNKRPSEESKNTEERLLGKWISHQNYNYKKSLDTLSDSRTRKIWEQFAKNNIFSLDDKWHNMLNQLRAYINKYNKLPVQTNKNNCIPDNKKWHNALNKLKTFIDENNKCPSRNGNKQESNLMVWIMTQRHRYKNKIHIMSDPSKRKIWEDFLKKYSKYMKPTEDKWFDSFNKLKNYLAKNNKRPPISSKKIKERKLGQWVNLQLGNIQKNIGWVTDPNKRQKLKNLMSKYTNIFDISCFDMPIQNKEKTTSNKPIDKNENKLALWILTQHQLYKKNKYALSDADKRKKWKSLILEYPKLFKASYIDKPISEPIKSTLSTVHKKRPNTKTDMNVKGRVKKVPKMVHYIEN